MPTTTAPLDDYEFDLRGFLLIRSALTPQEVESLNDAYDRIPPLSNGEWYGNAQRRDYTAATSGGAGFELHNVLDCGDPTFDVLIDHPSWVHHASRYAGEHGTYVQGVMIAVRAGTTRCIPAGTTPRSARSTRTTTGASGAGRSTSW